VECHGEPENHKALNFYCKITLNLLDICIVDLRGKNGENQLTPRISMSKICNSPLIMLLLLTSTSTKNQEKIRRMFLMHIISQITNLKVIGEVLGLRECYQCGGETLGKR
jgi:hypothetical protein